MPLRLIPLLVIAALAAPSAARAESIYVLVESETALRLAVSLGALKTVPLLRGTPRPVQTSRTFTRRTVTFSARPLPLSDPTVTSCVVGATLDVITPRDRPPGTYLQAHLTVTRRLGQDTWQYRQSVAVGLPAPSASRPVSVPLPRSWDVQLTTEAKVKGRQVAITLQTTVGGQPCGLLVNRKPPKIRLEIRNQAGTVVHRKDGTPDTFGYT